MNRIVNEQQISMSNLMHNISELVQIRDIIDNNLNRIADILEETGQALRANANADLMREMVMNGEDEPHDMEEKTISLAVEDEDEDKPSGKQGKRAKRAERTRKEKPPTVADTCEYWLDHYHRVLRTDELYNLCRQAGCKLNSKNKANCIRPALLQDKKKRFYRPDPENKSLWGLASWQRKDDTPLPVAEKSELIKLLGCGQWIELISYHEYPVAENKTHRHIGTRNSLLIPKDKHKMFKDPADYIEFWDRDQQTYAKLDFTKITGWNYV